MEKIAFELSFIDDKIPVELDKEGYFLFTDKVNALLKAKLSKLRESVPFIQFDGGNFEINSPVFYDKVSAIEYYDNTVKIMKRKGLVTHSNKSDGGGLHFHIDLPLNCYITLYTEMCQLINRLPYLNWIFNNPIDTWNGNNPYLNFKNEYKNANFEDYDNICLNILRGGKSNPIRFETEGTNRVEYRFFDMPYNKEEFKHIMDFVITLHDRLINHSWVNGTIDNSDFPKLKTLPMSFMVDKFKELLKQLSLDFNNYKVFVDRNMKKRYKYGKNYLI